jgi:hypothetical protein
MAAFDEAVYDLHKERLILTVDLKAAEVRRALAPRVRARA